ncbi:hypothetical protein P692DRAFT_20841583 [Suillus brevipes Sb2]|nr:hypothetical protein P692DRAFT_20841583 [Suillus brevipes Sb2]
MFTHQPVGRTYYRALFYGSGCSEAILTYVPQDLDGIVRAHMFIRCGQHFPACLLTPQITPVLGFPGSRFSVFRNAYSVIHFHHHPVLPVNQSLSGEHVDSNMPRWFGDVLVMKHSGHNLKTYQSIGYDERALVDAILSCLLESWRCDQ